MSAVPAPDLMRARIGCAPNFRDLGGLRTDDGRIVAYGRVFRSEAVSGPDAEDATRLAAHGIRLVCDLRGAHERDAAPNTWWQAQGTALLAMDITADIRGTSHLDAMREDPGEAGAVRLMRLTYEALPEAAARHLARLFERIAAGDLPLLVHCTAGKDRTGVVVALLLSALGVPREAILADYLESGAWPNPAVALATRAIMDTLLGAPTDDGALRALCGVRRDYLEASFAAIEARHDGVDAYLRERADLSAATRQAVRDRLLQ